MRFRNARLPDSRVVDIDVRGGLIVGVTEAGSTAGEPRADSIDLHRRLVLPAFAEPHTHLDKALLAERIDNPTNDLMGAIRALEAHRESITYADIVTRASRAASLFASHGVAKLRTHADTMSENQLQSVNALLEVKKKCADFIDIQVAMLLAWPVCGDDGAEHRELAEEAVRAGVDVVGGCPHLDDQPEAAVEFFLALAERHNLPLDLHADENLRPSSRDLRTLAERMLATNPRVRVNASHCVSLGMQDEHEQRETARFVAEAGITVTALPMTNLFLQARDIAVGPPRGITAVGILRSEGVTVAAGADNVQDPFNPMGKADPLETASLMVVAGHVDPAFALSAVSGNAHSAIGTKSPSIEAGEAADFVVLDVATPREAIAAQPDDRVVIHRGSVIHGQV